MEICDLSFFSIWQVNCWLGKDCDEDSVNEDTDEDSVNGDCDEDSLNEDTDEDSVNEDCDEESVNEDTDKDSVNEDTDEQFIDQALDEISDILVQQSISRFTASKLYEGFYFNLKYFIFKIFSKIKTS